jgi:hypothetical protein
MSKGMGKTLSVVIILVIVTLVILGTGALVDSNLESLINFSVSNSEVG